MDNFTPTVTNLINNRLGKAYPEQVSAELVESTFKFKDMNQAELASLFVNLTNETKIFSTCQDEIECETVQDMVDVGLVSFEWRDHNPDFGYTASFEKYAPPQDNNNNKYSDAFYKCFRDAANNSASDLFVCFDINKMAQYRGLCELDIFPRVAKYLIDGLGLDCILESLPVKPCRRKDCSEVWCQLVTTYKNEKVEKRHAMFIRDTPALGRSGSTPLPRKIRVYFAMDDSVDISNPWGSCPILHNGSNFRVPEYSRYFNEFTDAANDDDNVNNTCFIYSQKQPTLEIPSKLNIEAEVLMRGIIEKSDTLFVEGVKDEKLAIAMGMCHPKARVRHVALFFFSIHLPLASGLFPETKKCSFTNTIRVGSDALITTPNEVMDEVKAAAAKPADEENARGKELHVAPVANERDDADPALLSTSTPSPPSRSCFTKNSISRKMSIASYTCLACNDRCTENQRFSRPVHVIYNSSNIRFGSSSNSNSSSCYRDPLPQQNRQHLSHGRGYKLIDLLAHSDLSTMKQFASIIFPAAATSSNFNITNCERSAMCHNFFCEGIEPVKTDFSSDDITKSKLVLYGKVLDVTSSYSYNYAPDIIRRRVFYGQEEKKANKIPACSDDAKAAFKDILVHECNKDRVEGYLSNTKLGSGGNLHHRWWLKLPELTANFKKQVEHFYNDCVNVSDAASLKNVFSQFYGVCKRYKTAKAQLLEDGKRRPAAAGEEGDEEEEEDEEDEEEDEEEEDEEVGEREEGDGDDESKNERLLQEVVNALVEFHARDDAITSTMIHKSMLLGSRTIVSGTRCMVSTSPRWTFEVRQYVISMGGSAVTKVSDENLKRFTPVKGAVSVTTAPDDRLPFGAHQTWRNSPPFPDSGNTNNNNGKGRGNFNNANDRHDKERSVNEPWRVLDNTSSSSNNRGCRLQQQINHHKPAAAVPVVTNVRTASNYSSDKYIPPHRRRNAATTTAT